MLFSSNLVTLSCIFDLDLSNCMRVCDLRFLKDRNVEQKCKPSMIVVFPALFLPKITLMELEGANSMKLKPRRHDAENLVTNTTHASA